MAGILNSEWGVSAFSFNVWLGGAGVECDWVKKMGGPYQRVNRVSLSFADDIFFHHIWLCLIIESD